ncbi:hypothetical protein [Deinococcus misasensis]|uniref:hypothetical protein n=1 Tax=Deinococcus misasensis TaxID=392413 RepID=UPI000558CB28|nr:hypothetical protein [Deinococcus misasensis]
MRQQRSGYTLIEILVLVGILTILFSLGVGSYQSYQKAVQLNEMVEKTAGLIRDTQEASMTNSQSYLVDYVPASTTFEVRDSSSTLIRTLKLPYGEANNWINDIVFLSRGLPQQQYQFNLKNGARTRTVYVLTTGKVIVR